jgi:hypothetical protein
MVSSLQLQLDTVIGQLRDTDARFDKLESLFMASQKENSAAQEPGQEQGQRDPSPEEPHQRHRAAQPLLLRPHLQHPHRRRGERPPERHEAALQQTPPPHPPRCCREKASPLRAQLRPDHPDCPRAAWQGQQAQAHLRPLLPPPHQDHDHAA